MAFANLKELAEAKLAEGHEAGLTEGQKAGKIAAQWIARAATGSSLQDVLTSPETSAETSA